MSQITEHLSTEEFRCSHCHKLPPDMYDENGDLTLYYDVLFNAFENLRVPWGKPINVVSGYRCPVHNLAIGGATISAHLFGALDMLFKDKVEAEKFAELVDEEEPDMRMGNKQYKDPLIHLDPAFLVSPRPSEAFIRGARW